MRSSNNFDVLRLAAALLVLASHSYPLTASREPVAAFLGYITGGGIAVTVFFFISGYLITISASQRSLPDFLVARALRILPALFIVSLFDIFIIGFAFTSLTSAEYFSDSLTWRHLNNAFVFGLSPRLPGVFSELPNRLVNGSLWTIPLELTMYMLSAIFLVAKVRSFRVFAVVALGSAIAFVIAVRFFDLSWSNKGPHILPRVPLYNFLNLAYFFFAGAAFSTIRERIPLDGRMAIGCLTLIVLSAYLPWGRAIYFLALPYLLHYAALTSWRSGSMSADLSYGVYLYAFPVQQSVTFVIGPEAGPWAVTALSTPIVCVLAWLSWKFVEEPMLRKKPLRHRDAVSPSPIHEEMPSRH